MTLTALSHIKSEHFSLRIFLAGLLFGFFGILSGYAVSVFFPQVEASLYDWQLSVKAPTIVDSSILIMTLDEHDSVSCGNDRWNSWEMSKMISALHQAGAAVIAPAVRFEIPNTPECGDVLGNAQLLEATRQAGNVVYPSTIQPLFANEALTTGRFQLPVEQDGTFRGLSLEQQSNEMGHVPYGLAITTVYKGGQSLHRPDQGLVPFVGRWAAHPFPTYTFTQLFNLIQGRQDVQLSALVRDKIVMIFPVDQNEEMLRTPLEPAAPLGFLHANVLNTALTNSWLQKPSWTSWSFMTGSFALIIALLIAWRSGIWGSIGVGIITIFYFILAGLYFGSEGVIWPLLRSIVALTIVLVGTTMWAMHEHRGRLRHQIENVSAKLTAMQEKFARKELVVEQLEEDLLEAKDHAQKTSQRDAEEDETRMQLREAEAEAEDARQQLEKLQHELKQLRKVSPALPIDKRGSPDSDQQQLQREAEAFGILTCSPVLLKTFQELKRAARTDSPILILGETGTGKELFAQAAHRLSKRSQGPFVSVNMAAIRPELFESELFGHVKGAFTGAISRRGLLETADRGSVFLDEVGELPLDLQAKLLRVLESGMFYRVGQSSPTQVDVRIIAATNRDLSQAVKDGHYREDLYYRLRSLVFRLSPLRERGEEDLTLLVRRIMENLSPDKERGPVQVTQGAMEAIQAYAWPGNVRELRQTLAQAVALAERDVLTEQDLRLPQHEKKGTRFDSHVSDVDARNLGSKDEMARREDAFVLSTLRQHRFDMQATAKTLEWDRSTVTQRLKGIGFQALVDHAGDVHGTAVTLADNPFLEKIVELKLREYYRNLLSSTTPYNTPEQALENCRKRLRNIPERHFPAIETLIRQHFADSVP